MCPFTSQKSTFIPNWPFHFPHVSFCFPEVPPFYFSKMSFCFPELPFSFPETPSFYLLWASFSKNAFFPAACTFAQVRTAYKDDICLALVLRPFGTLYRPTCDSLLITLIPLHGVWFFMHYVPKKHYGPFLWMGFNCLIASVTSRRQFTASNLVQRNRKGGNNTIHPCTPTRLEVSGI